jgi:hypothetical protein
MWWYGMIEVTIILTVSINVSPCSKALLWHLFSANEQYFSLEKNSALA